MQNPFKKFRRLFINREFISFCLCGAVNTFNTAWLSTVSHIVITNRNAAAVIGYLCSLSIAFFIDSKFVFHNRPSRKKYFKFLVSYIPNFIIYFLVTFMTINTWHLSQFWATALATVIGGPITYIIMHFYAFSKR